MRLILVISLVLLAVVDADKFCFESDCVEKGIGRTRVDVDRFSTLNEFIDEKTIELPYNKYNNYTVFHYDVTIKNEDSNMFFLLIPYCKWNGVYFGHYSAICNIGNHVPEISILSKGKSTVTAKVLVYSTNYTS